MAGFVLRYALILFVMVWVVFQVTTVPRRSVRASQLQAQNTAALQPHMGDTTPQLVTAGMLPFTRLDRTRGVRPRTATQLPSNTKVVEVKELSHEIRHITANQHRFITQAKVPQIALSETPSPTLQTSLSTLPSSVIKANASAEVSKPSDTAAARPKRIRLPFFPKDINLESSPDAELTMLPMMVQAQVDTLHAQGELAQHSADVTANADSVLVANGRSETLPNMGVTVVNPFSPQEIEPIARRALAESVEVSTSGLRIVLVPEQARVPSRPAVQQAQAGRGTQTAQATQSRTVSQGYTEQQHIWPLPMRGTVTSNYGPRSLSITKSRFHYGVDIAVSAGTPILSTKSGKIEYAGWAGSYGYAVYVRHDDGVQTRYAHMNRVLVDEGQQVRQGEWIGFVGSTGLSTGPHLHFELHVSGRAVNPRTYLGAPVAQLASR